MGQSPDLVWKEGGVPVATRFDDPYFSLQDGLAETRYVFLDGNDLPARFRPGFHVAELGFGTGLNALATARAFHKAKIPGALYITSFEVFPLESSDIARALARFETLTDLAATLTDAWATGARNFPLTPAVTLNVIVGDARETVPAWTGAADAWFLDGFAPAKNPELWEPDLLQQVVAHTNPGGTLATYTAAGHVRRGLEAAGFEVTRRPGFGRKRHMTSARLR